MDFFYMPPTLHETMSQVQDQQYLAAEQFSLGKESDNVA